MTFKEKWFDAVKKKNSILCIGLDAAEFGQREKGTVPEKTDKLEWCLSVIEEQAEYAAAVKPNRNYIKDFSRKETKMLTNFAHRHGLLVIDDSKLADIGETNDSGLYHAKMEGFDAVTYAPFPGNAGEAKKQADKHGVGLIQLVLMSNKEFEAMKNADFDGIKGYEYFATQVYQNDIDAMVIGAPSPKNHLKDFEIERVRELTKEANPLVLMPGVGAQGGDASYITKIFGWENVIANVGRALIYPDDGNIAKAATEYRDMLNKLRG